MTNQNEEFTFILNRTRWLLRGRVFPFVDPAVNSKYFPSIDKYRSQDEYENFDVDLHKMEAEEPELFRQVAELLFSSCDMLFNANCSREDVWNCSSLIDYSMLVSRTSNVHKYV
jgi:hypothetical protein